MLGLAGKTHQLALITDFGVEQGGVLDMNVAPFNHNDATFTEEAQAPRKRFRRHAEVRSNYFLAGFQGDGGFTGQPRALTGQFDQIIEEPLRTGHGVVVTTHIELNRLLALSQLLNNPPAQINIVTRDGTKLSGIKRNHDAGGNRLTRRGVARTPKNLTQAQYLLGLCQFEDFFQFTAQGSRALDRAANQDIGLANRRASVKQIIVGVVFNNSAGGDQLIQLRRGQPGEWRRVRQQLALRPHRGS